MKTFADIQSSSFLLAVLAFIVVNSSSQAQILSPSEKAVVVETVDGMIVSGTIDKTEENITALKTMYGSLAIPLSKILRVDGDTFDPKRGIIREHSVALHRDGSVILEYLQPVAARYDNNEISLLTMGNVLSIQDLNGEPLDYMARKIGDLTRCAITMPEYRLPAVRIQVIQSTGARIQDGQLEYTYRYTPRIEQIFCLKVEIPAGAVLLEAHPEPVEKRGDGILWQETLRRQQTIEFTIRLKL